MDEPLPLTLDSRLPFDRPFTPAMARAAGLDRAALDRLLREGAVRRLLRGVYAAPGATDDAAGRAVAVALATGPDSIAVTNTAAWVHGVDIPALLRAPLVPVEAVTPGAGRRSERRLLGRDVQTLGPLRLTTPLRTALDLGRILPAGAALAAMDALLAGGSFRLSALLAELARFGGHRGVAQLRDLAAQVDARAGSAAESVLRLHWHRARLPTPVPGLSVVAGGRLVRLALGVERRQFGAVLSEEVTAADLVALQGAGWRVVPLPAERVLGTDPAFWVRHLEREFHQQLLAQTG